MSKKCGQGWISENKDCTLDQQESEESNRIKLVQEKEDSTEVERKQSVLKYKLDHENLTERDKSNIDDFLQESEPYNGKIYRGLNFSFNEYEKWIEKNQSTIEVDDPTSFTFGKNIAKNYAGIGNNRVEVSVIIEVESNKKGIDISEIGERRQDEKEVLIPKGTKYKVKDIVGDEESSTVTMRVIEQ